MAGLFDFEKCYTDKTVKTSISLDISGLNLKSSASASAENEDGTADDVGMNEYVTNNVMYKVSLIDYGGAAAIASDRFCIEYTTAEGISDKVYTSIGYAIDELVAAGIVIIPESRSPLGITSITVGQRIKDTGKNADPNDVGTLINTITRFDELHNNAATACTTLSMAFIPRMRLMNATKNAMAPGEYSTPYYIEPGTNLYNSVSQEFWHEAGGSTTYFRRALGALGFNGSKFLGLKWYNKQASNNPVATWGLDNIANRVKTLSKEMNDNGLSISITYYDDEYADRLDPGEEHTEEEKAAADWTRTEIPPNAKCEDVYPDALVDFYQKARGRETDGNDNTSDPMPIMEGEGATALVPNVADAFKKYFYPAEELAANFTEQYFDVYNGIRGMSGLRKFMSTSLKRKLDAEQWKLIIPFSDYPKNMDNGNNGITFGIDLTSTLKHLSFCADAVKSNYNGDNPHSLSMDMDWSRIDDFINNTRALGNTNWEVLYCRGVNRAGNGVGVTWYQISDDFERKPEHEGLYHKASWFKDFNYKDKVIKTKQYKVADIKATLAEYFTAVYNKFYEHEEGDIYYANWTYDKDAKQFRVAIKTSGSTIEYLISNNTAGDGREFYYSTFVDPHSLLVTPVYEDIDKMELKSGLVQMFSTIMLRELYGLSVATSTYTNAHHDFISAQNDTTGVSAANYDVANPEDDYVMTLVEWDEASIPSDVTSYWSCIPQYETYQTLGSNSYDIDNCIDFIDTMGDAIDELDTILNVQGLFLGATYLLIQKMRISGVKDDYDDLEETVAKIKWYQCFTNESVFPAKSFIGTRPSYCPYVYMPARFLIPVRMYKRVRVKYKRWGRTRHKTVKRYAGVRWAEITFLDNDVYEAYPQNADEPRQYYPIGKTARVTYGSNGYPIFTFDENIELASDSSMQKGDITQFTSGTLVVMGEYEQSVTFNQNANVFTGDEPSKVIISGNEIFVNGIYVPLEPTQKTDERTPIRIEYKMPYIPMDSELRHWAFETYGPFDQSIYAEQSREVPSDPDTKVPGWQVFRHSSKRIGDLRASMGIYDAASILIGILRNAYGTSNVEVVETMRSLDDQQLMCSGGNECDFLSWHNYGLAIRILINDPATGMPIEDGSPQMRQLIDIAEAYTNACFNGAFGKPLNVVWCGRLKMGANIFDWEFLPIGIGHKDAIKFRDSILNQEDPVATLGFVDVDAAGYAVDVRTSKATGPYILRKSQAYKNAVVINGHHYVSPAKIREYETPKNLVMYNVLEFVNLVNLKMSANGTSLNDRGSMFEWMAVNTKSYRQLVTYFAMTGNISAARTLVSGEYIEKYRNLIDTKYSEDYVSMVKEFLGDLYKDAKIYIEGVGDSGAWISLCDGRIHIKVLDVRPALDQRYKDNYFGQKKVTPAETERGLWIKGIFYTEERLEKMGDAELTALGVTRETVSERSFIDGLSVDGTVSGGDARHLHSLIASQIKEEFDKLREKFDNYGGKVMYDKFADGPNYESQDMLENEFGIIAGQDLIDFDKLRDIFNRQDINTNSNVPVSSDGTVNGIGTNGIESIYEPVVSNAQLAGVRKASLSREHVQVNARVTGMSTEQLYKLITKGRMTSGNDLFRK